MGIIYIYEYDDAGADADDDDDEEEEGEEDIWGLMGISPVMMGISCLLGEKNGDIQYIAPKVLYIVPNSWGYNQYQPIIWGTVHCTLYVALSQIGVYLSATLQYSQLNGDILEQNLGHN